MSFQQNYQSRFTPGATEVLKFILKMFCRVKARGKTHPDPEIKVERFKRANGRDTPWP